MKCYGGCPPGIGDEPLPGKLIVLEGPDAVGRSTHIGLLANHLEAKGQAVAQVGLSRSSLAAPELEQAKAGHDLRPYPMALFYAADFFDQLENRVIPALRAGMVVLADRYVHTLIARSIVRGLDPDQIKNVYSGALVPHAVLALQAKPKELVARMLHKFGQLDYWEAGMDLGLSTDWHASFVKYQKAINRTWKEHLAESHPYTPINANRIIASVHKDVVRHVEALL